MRPLRGLRHWRHKLRISSGLALSQCGRACPTVERSRTILEAACRRQDRSTCRVLRTLQHYLGIVTQGCGRSGLTLGYIHASPTGTKALAPQAENIFWAMPLRSAVGLARPSLARSDSWRRLAADFFLSRASHAPALFGHRYPGLRPKRLTLGYIHASPTGTKASPPTRPRHLLGLPYRSTVGQARPSLANSRILEAACRRHASVACFARSDIFPRRVPVGQARPHCAAASRQIVATNAEAACRLLSQPRRSWDSSWDK